MTIDINGFAGRLKRRENGGMISGWVGIPDAMLVNHLAQEDFDTLVLDMQHGMWDMASAANGIAHVRLAGKPAIARIPVGDFASASRLLDAGASAIIAPMINSADDARALVKATKYPPLGERSWGPSLALNHFAISAEDYLQSANSLTVTIAMVETRTALDAIDEILAVDGIDQTLELLQQRVENFRQRRKQRKQRDNRASCRRFKRVADPLAQVVRR